MWLAHIGLWVAVSDCTQPHDSSLTVELIARALERAKDRYDELGLMWPRELLIFVSALRFLLAFAVDLQALLHGLPTNEC